MKNLLLKISAIVVMAFFVLGNLTVNIDDANIGIGSVIAVMAFGDDLPGHSGTECNTQYSDNCGPWPHQQTCKTFKYCQPEGIPCSDVVNKLPEGNLLPC